MRLDVCVNVCVFSFCEYVKRLGSASIQTGRTPSPKTNPRTPSTNHPIRLGAEVTGLDPSPANIDVARKHAAADPLTRGIRYEAAPVEEFIGGWVKWSNGCMNND